MAWPAIVIKMDDVSVLVYRQGERMLVLVLEGQRREGRLEQSLCAWALDA